MKNKIRIVLIGGQSNAVGLTPKDTLDEKYREPAILRFIKEYEYNEIAQELNLELNTVKTRLKRAKEILKRENNL